MMNPRDANADASADAGTDVDVLVVGAGPAGTVAAAVLSHTGMRVLLVGSGEADGGEPGGGSWDVLLTEPASSGLAAAGLAVPAPAGPIEVIDLRFGDQSHHPVTGSSAAVHEWHPLREALWQHAVQAGARPVLGTVTAISVGTEDDDYRAVVVLREGGELRVTARHVVAACGSGTGSGLVPAGAPHATGTTCVRRYTGAGLSRHMVLLLPAPPATGGAARPLCVWALPADADTVTVGVTSVGAGTPAPATLMDAAEDALALADPRFSRLRPAGPVSAGPTDAGFSPQRVAQAPFLLVGAAAGLVNPFTGEGISYAVQSGLMAARVIVANPGDPGAARRRYARRVAATFVGYFETARHSARRYHLAWRILAAGAGSEHPFFAKGRRAVLLPEGFHGLTASERIDLAGPDRLLIAPFLAACDEVTISTVRGEWPFLARLAIAGDSLGQQRLRPAIPFFAALAAEGSPPDVRRAPVGSAIELALLGALALLGPMPAPAEGRTVDWALTATVLAADFLLSQASRLVAEYAPELSWSFSDWLAELVTLRTARLATPPTAPASAVYASLLEFPARIGALLGDGTPETVRALREFGRLCGCAFGHTEDVLALRGERTRLDTTLAVMLGGGFSSIPERPGGEAVTGDLLATDAGVRSEALRLAVADCHRAHNEALRALSGIPGSMAQRILRGFVGAVTAPVSGGWPSPA